MEEKYEIKVIQLSKVTCKTEYKEKLKHKWERVQGEVPGEAEEECNKHMDKVLDGEEEVCGRSRNMEGMIRKGSEY